MYAKKILTIPIWFHPGWMTFFVFSSGSGIYIFFEASGLFRVVEQRTEIFCLPLPSLPPSHPVRAPATPATTAHAHTGHIYTLKQCRQPYSRTGIQAHTCAHTHRHTQAQANARTWMRNRKWVSTHTLRTLPHTCTTHTLTHILTHTLTHTLSHANKHMYTCAHAMFIKYSLFIFVIHDARKCTTCKQQVFRVWKEQGFQGRDDAGAEVVIKAQMHTRRRARTHPHARAHICSHTLVQRYTRKHTHVHTRTCTAHTLAYTYVRARSHTRTCVHTSLSMGVNARTHTHTHKVHACTCTCLHYMHKHAQNKHARMHVSCTYTYTHTHIHTRTYTDGVIRWGGKGRERRSLVLMD